MTKKENDFVKTINWIQYNLELDYKEREILDYEKRLSETISELKKALQDLNDSYN